MNNIRLTVFDIFSYMIPGLCYLFLFFGFIDITDISNIKKMISDISILQAVSYSLLSYLIGFISDTIAQLTILPLTDKIRGNIRNRVLDKYLKENNLPQEGYHFSSLYSFIDAKAPHVREKVDQFSAMSGMARNLSLAFLVYSIVMIIIVLINSEITGDFSILRLFSAVIISFLLVIRADKFRQWSHIHLLNVYVLLLNQEYKKDCQEPSPNK